MKRKKKYISTGSNAGKKREATELPVKSFRLIERCADCPIWAYREVVCNDNLKALVIDGNPPTEELEKAAAMVISEFTELSSGGSGVDPKLREVYLRHSLVMLYSLCMESISYDHYDEALSVLREHGLSFEKPANEKEKAAILKKIESRLKSENVKLREARDTYSKEAQKQTVKSKITTQSFNKQLTSLEMYFGTVSFSDDDKITKLARYIDMYNSIDKKQPPIKKGYGRNV